MDSGKGRLIVWIILVLALVSMLAFVYSGSLGIGFLLDDFYHIDYLTRAFNGDNSELMNTLFGSMSGPTGLTSFRPILSLGFCLDYLIWGVNASGYHLTNLILFGGCCVFLALITNELCKFNSSSIVVCGLAVLLFIFYPLHPESVSWIIGRVDSQCCLFYLASLFAYFRFRKQGLSSWLVLSVISFFLALGSKEMAVTLPVVVLAAEILLCRELGWQEQSSKTRCGYVACFFLLLACFAGVRTLAIGSLVGGYGSTSPASIVASLGNFLDFATFKKLLFGINEELGPEQVPIYAVVSLSVIGLILAYQLIVRRQVRVILFLLTFIIISVLPTFQIWHIYPNLVGSRLFFLGSVPFCALLAYSLMVVLPPGRGAKQRVFASFIVLAVISMSVVWFNVIENNKVWLATGQIMNQLRVDLRAAVDSLERDQFVLLVDLPQDNKGAGMIGRPEYLKRMLSPPISPVDYSARVITSELVLSRSQEFLFADELLEVASNPHVGMVLRWNGRANRYQRFEPPKAEGRQFDRRFIGSDIRQSQGNLHWLSKTRVLPFDNAWLKLIFKKKLDPDALKVLSHKLQLIYRSSKQPESWIDYSIGPSARLDGDGLIFVCGRNRNWLLEGDIVDIGFSGVDKIPEIDTVEIGPALSIMPSISIHDCSNGSPLDCIVSRLPRDTKLSVSFDASSIEGAVAARIMIAKPYVALDVEPTGVVPGAQALARVVDVRQTSGQVEIDLTKQKGISQVIVLALDAQGKPLGYLSEARSFLSE